MMIVISGGSHVGKTNMAQNLLQKYSYPYLSIDHLKMGIYRGVRDCGFTPTDRNEVIGDKLWPIIKGIIMTARKPASTFLKSVPITRKKSPRYMIT